MKEHKKTYRSDTIIDFLNHFEIVRPGHYSVDIKMVGEMLTEFSTTGKMVILEEYELILFASWSYDEHYRDPMEDEPAYRILKIINNSGNTCLKYLPNIDVDRARMSADDAIYFNSIQRGYKARREAANKAIQNKDLRKAVFLRDRASCVFCGSVENISIDHIISVKNGGESNITNLQTLCRTCNSRKGAS